MDTSVKRRTPRRRRGSVEIQVKDYIPRLFENQDYIFGSRTFSLYQIKSGGKTYTRKASQRDAILRKRIAWLQSNYGLSFNSASILLSRKKAQFRRIEELLHGVIDSLLLFDLQLFIKAEGRKILRHIVRKALVVSTYNIGQTISYWKSLNDFLYNRLADFQPPVEEPGKENLFRVLLSWPKIQRILNRDVDKRLLESFAHLTSSRQLPAGDRRAEEKALRTFRASITEPYPKDVELLSDIRQVSCRIGEKCVSLSDRRIVTKPHISMSCAGSYAATVLEGGRGKEIRDALTSRLTVIPEEDESIDTPFGLLCCPKGRPRWRYWCRNDNPYLHYEDTPFGSAIKEEVFAEQNLYYQGFDEAIGVQILVTAYLDYLDWKLTGLGIPCRVLVVPEPGYKARIVTTGPYWLNILQQGLAHQLKDILKGHPSVRTSLQKTDQAWQSLYLFCKQGYPMDYACLSSDLKEATDHIPKVVALQLLAGFIEGTGIRSNLIDVSLDLLRMDRTFIGPDFVSEGQTRGVMMGEPLTKVVLSIMNLAVEELAYRKYHKVSIRKSFFKSDPLRTYHVGGDDHLAIGPKQYLDYITSNHLKFGNHLSSGKHGISRIAVKYCEKVIDVRNIYHPWSLEDLNKTTQGYETSPFVDSIKVRLLSPTTKSFDVVSDRNVAIGKGLSLGRTLKWLNRDHFPIKWVKMVRDRFFERMGSLLPDRSSGVYWQLMLPSYWGGLNLYMDDEVELMYNKLPELTLSIMEGSYRGEEPSSTGAKELRKFLTNYSYRGYRLNETETQLMTAHIETVIKFSLPSMKWEELKLEFDPEGHLSANELSDRIYSEGWHSEEHIKDELLRPLLFKEILLGVEKLSPYNTVRLKTRYSRLWDLVYRGRPNLTLEEFRVILKTRPQDRFYKVGYPEEIHFVSDRGYIYKSALDDALHGMPVLSIGFPYT